MKYPQNYNYYLTLIQFIENYIGFYRMSDIELGKEFKINFLKCELELYKKELTKTLPIIKEAVILRKFVKILLEKLIIKNIDNIDINDYIPNPSILLNYQKSLNSHYIFRKGIKNDDRKEKNKIKDDNNIEDKIKEEIKLAGIYYEITEKDNMKKNSKITYKKENNITKIIEILFKMKELYRRVSHFVDESLVEYKNINNYIFDASNINMEEDENNSNNEIIEILNKQKNENKDDNIKISINKVAKFIAFRNSHHKLMKDLNIHYQKFLDDYNCLRQQKISLPENYNINKFNDYKEDILRIKEKMDRDLRNFSRGILH